MLTTSDNIVRTLKLLQIADTCSDIGLGQY